MKSIAFINGTVVLPDRQLDEGMVCCDESKIVYVGQRESLPSEPESLTRPAVWKLASKQIFW